MTGTSSARSRGCFAATQADCQGLGMLTRLLPATSAALHPCVEPDFAVVDVETTGLNTRRDRVVQIAITGVRRSGEIEQSWSTVVDPQRDPGPVHIHGVTTERLIGAPRFVDLEPKVAELLRGRILVAHNAQLDWGMLAAETARASGAIQVDHRLCTMALARRLELDLPDLRLASLAAHYGVVPRRAHDATDDTRVLAEILPLLLEQARSVGTVLPLATCARFGGTPWPHDRAPKMESPWTDPGPWKPTDPLVPGAKFVVTGSTRTPRLDLYDRAAVAGLVPMSSVSRRTRFAVCDDSRTPTAKARAAAAHGVPVIDEVTFPGPARPRRTRVRRRRLLVRFASPPPQARWPALVSWCWAARTPTPPRSAARWSPGTGVWP